MMHVASSINISFEARYQLIYRPVLVRDLVIENHYSIPSISAKSLGTLALFLVII